MGKQPKQREKKRQYVEQCRHDWAPMYVGIEWPKVCKRCRKVDGNKRRTA